MPADASRTVETTWAEARCITISEFSVQPGLYLCFPDSICASIVLYLWEMDTTARGVNKKGKNHVNYLKFSKVSLFTGLLKLYSSSLCWYLARTLFQFIITRWVAD